MAYKQKEILSGHQKSTNKTNKKLFLRNPDSVQFPLIDAKHGHGEEGNWHSEGGLCIHAGSSKGYRAVMVLGFPLETDAG